jgi:APA family basic amino acid/polyamine antiporter
MTRMTTMTGVQAPSAAQPRLVRGIRRWDIVALVINSVIGAGIFGLPARVFGLAGPVYSLVAYVLCAALVVLLVLCFAEVSSRFETTGGPYLYARHAFGSAVGFQMGWLLWLARVTAFAALANLWVDYLGFFWPGAVAARGLVITAMVAAFTVLNIVGVRSSAVAIDAFTIGKLLPLAFFIVVGLFAIDPSRFTASTPPGFTAFSDTVLLLVFAFSGFEMAVIPSGEQNDPRRHVPFALIAGIAVVVVFYILIQVVAVGTLPELATSQRPLADAAAGFLGPAGAAIIAAGALVSVSGTLNSIVLVGPRLLFAMAENRQLPAAFAATHARFKTPWLAIVVTSATQLVLTLQGTFISALTISTVIRLIAYAGTCVALLMLRRRSDVPAATFRVPAGTVVAVAAIALCAWLVSSSALRDLLFTAGAAAVGLVLYLAAGRRESRAPAAG